MKRRHFLATGLGAMVAGAAVEGSTLRVQAANPVSLPNPGERVAAHPRDTKIHVKPVMTNVIHSSAWQGPCRPTAASPEVEKTNAEQWFAGWASQIKTNGLGRARMCACWSRFISRFRKIG